MPLGIRSALQALAAMPVPRLATGQGQASVHSSPTAHTADLLSLGGVQKPQSPTRENEGVTVSKESKHFIIDF